MGVALDGASSFLVLCHTTLDARTKGTWLWRVTGFLVFPSFPSSVFSHSLKPSNLVLLMWPQWPSPTHLEGAMVPQILRENWPGWGRVWPWVRDTALPADRLFLQRACCVQPVALTVYAHEHP